MLSFESDYITGAHPKILEALTRTNLEQHPGYGADVYCERAKEKIRAACQAPNADVRFLVGGTQTNKIVIGTALAGYEGVIAAETGHVSLHEGGAIESTGHKVITLPHQNGKLNAATVEQYLLDFYADGAHEHMVAPGMVYISHPTEYGTLYTKDELTALSQLCRRYELPLFLDGARLGYGLMSLQTDVTLPDIAALCDVFYIGGTKVGALCGEAVVFTRNNTPKNFITLVKQHGALLAKGRLLGVQFDVLFTDGLYFSISRHAIDMAERLKELFARKGYRFYMESPTNQQFIILENAQMEALSQRVAFSFWEKYDETHTVVRFATSWSTSEEDLQALEAIL
ncbi:MAG: low specificity L-threonine aldolase [Clostridia bacterium]|nr:low specificity L-threonine aldolase [Clostridia bacterium]